MLRLSTCPLVVNFICHLFANGCQFEKLLLNDACTTQTISGSKRRHIGNLPAVRYLFQNEHALLAAKAGVCRLIGFGTCCENAVCNCSTPSPQLVLQALRFFFHS